MKKYCLYFFLIFSFISLHGITYTVDNNGTADFNTIQEAVDFANSGDTIFVKAGTYQEMLHIHKDIVLLGEKMDSTIIKYNSGTVIDIAGNCIINGFTITSTDSFTANGICLNPSYFTEISNNKITSTNYGINILDSPIWAIESYYLYCPYDSCCIKIFGNTITNNKIGIYLDGVYYTGGTFDEKVTYNATENWWGTTIEDSIKKEIFDWEQRIVNYQDWLLEQIKSPVEKQKDGIHRNNIYENIGKY